jgi:hypothetical protein
LIRTSAGGQKLVGRNGPKGFVCFKQLWYAVLLVPIALPPQRFHLKEDCHEG